MVNNVMKPVPFVSAVENNGIEGSESGCLNLLADAAMSYEEDLQAAQNSNDTSEEDPEVCQEVEKGEEGPQGCGKAGHVHRQQPSYLGKRKLEGAEL